MTAFAFDAANEREPPKEEESALRGALSVWQADDEWGETKRT